MYPFDIRPESRGCVEFVAASECRSLFSESVLSADEIPMDAGQFFVLTLFRRTHHICGMALLSGTSDVMPPGYALYMFSRVGRPFSVSLECHGIVHLTPLRVVRYKTAKCHQRVQGSTRTNFLAAKSRSVSNLMTHCFPSC